MDRWCVSSREIGQTSTVVSSMGESVRLRAPAHLFLFITAVSQFKRAFVVDDDNGARFTEGTARVLVIKAKLLNPKESTRGSRWPVEAVCIGSIKSSPQLVR